MSDSPFRAALAVALEAEARPLINRFRLRRNLAISPFAVYQREPLSLVVTGIGKIHAAAAVGFLSHLFSPTLWLNVGTAGHPELPLGTVRLAHKIVDGDTGKAFYPQLLFQPPVGTADLVTVSRPENDFRESVLYDMEASGFLEAARHFTTLEWIQVVKVVSDNGQNPFRREDVAELMEATLPTVEALLEWFRELHDELETSLPLDLNRIAAELRLSTALRLRLEKLLQKWRALSPETLPAEEELVRFDRDTLLLWLKRKLEALERR